MQDLRQSTASQIISLGQFLDSTDGDSEENGLTISNTDIKIRKNGATTLANKSSGGATNISNGVYHATLNATDSNTLGRLEIYVHVAGALAVKATFRVLTATAFDAIYAGTFNNLGGTAQTADNDTKISLIPTTAMRGTDNAATSAKQDTMETTLNAIPTTAMRGTDSAATSTKQDTMETTLNAIPTTAMRGTDGVDTATMRGTDNAATETKQDIIDTNVDTINTSTAGLSGAAMRGTDGANTATPLTFSQIWTTQLTESYASDGIAPTPAQALFITMQNLQSFTFVGTTQTVRRINDSTTAATYTLDDATNPTAKERTT